MIDQLMLVILTPEQRHGLLGLRHWKRNLRKADFEDSCGI
jgi:hypothetical protein